MIDPRDFQAKATSAKEKAHRITATVTEDENFVTIKLSKADIAQSRRSSALDENGKPKLNKDGKPKGEGQYGFMLEPVPYTLALPVTETGADGESVTTIARIPMALRAGWVGIGPRSQAGE